MGGFLALIAALSFTLDSILIRKGLTGENAGNVWQIRLVTMSVTLAVYLLLAFFAEMAGLNVIQEFKALSFEGLAVLILAGVMGPLMGLLLLTSAIGQIGSSHASALWGGANPLFATLFAFIFLGEMPDLLGVFFVLMIIGGIVIVGYHRHAGTVVLMKKTQVAGGIIAILSGVCIAISQIGRGAALNLGATPGTALFIFQITALIVIALVCLRKPGSFKYLKQISRKSFHYYVGAGICNFVGAYSLLTAFLLLPVWQAVAIRNIQPVFVVIFSMLFLKEVDKVNFRLIMGTILVTLGVVFLNIY